MSHLARRLSCALLALALLLAVGLPAAAQDDGPVQRSSADYEYGQTMRFHLLASRDREVSAVRLYFRLNTSPDSFMVEVPAEPGPRVDVSYALDLSETRLPPFSSITYWWEVDTADGQTTRVPEQVVTYVDDQFQWRQLVRTDAEAGGSIRIHWTGDDETLGETAWEVTGEMLPRIGQLVPLDHIVPFDIYIYPSTADLGAALRLAGREYQPRQTYPDLGVVLTTVVNPETAESELRDGLSRGLVDLLLFQSLGQFAYKLPPWLNRGIAGVVRGEPNAVQDNVLANAVGSRATIALADLCVNYPPGSELAEAQSESVMRYIIDSYGEAAVGDLVLAFAEGGDCRTVIQQTLNISPEQLDRAWQRTMRRGEPGLGQMVRDNAIWFVLIAAGFGLASLLIFQPSRRG